MLEVVERWRRIGVEPRLQVAQRVEHRERRVDRIEAEPVVTVLGDAYARVHGVRPALQATTATTDVRHFVRAGIPAVCFGPRGERIHGIDERVSLRSVTESAQVLGLFIRDWCGLA